MEDEVIYAEIGTMSLRGELGKSRVQFVCSACGEESLDMTVGQGLILMAEHVCDRDLEGISLGVTPMGV